MPMRSSSRKTCATTCAAARARSPRCPPRWRTCRSSASPPSRAGGRRSGPAAACAPRRRSREPPRGRVARTRDGRDAPVLDEHRRPLAHRRRVPSNSAGVREPGAPRRRRRIVEQTGEAMRHPGTVSEARGPGRDPHELGVPSLLATSSAGAGPKRATSGVVGARQYGSVGSPSAARQTARTISSRRAVLADVAGRTRRLARAARSRGRRRRRGSRRGCRDSSRARCAPRPRPRFRACAGPRARRRVRARGRSRARPRRWTRPPRRPGPRASGSRWWRAGRRDGRRLRPRESRAAVLPVVGASRPGGRACALHRSTGPGGHPASSDRTSAPPAAHPGVTIAPCPGSA